MGDFDKAINEAEQALYYYLESNGRKNEFSYYKNDFLKGFESGWKLVESKPNEQAMDYSYEKVLGWGLEHNPINFGIALGVVACMFEKHEDVVLERIAVYTRFLTKTKLPPAFYNFIIIRMNALYKKIETELKKQEEQKKRDPRFKINPNLKKKYLVFLEFYKSL